MLKKFIRVLLPLCMVGIITLSVSLPSSAYSFESYRLENGKLRCYYDNWLDLKAKTAVTAGVGAWEKKVSSVSFVPQGGVPVYFSVENSPDVSWDGICTTEYYTSTGYAISSLIRFNSAKPAWNDPQALQSVAVHEMGHVMGLADLDLYTEAIMNKATYGPGSRYEEYALTEPCWDDIQGITALYG